MSQFGKSFAGLPKRDQPSNLPPKRPTYDERLAAIHQRWQTCPVCFGKGIVPQGFYATPGFGGVATHTVPDTCRSCSGRGIVK